ncbi:MAG: glycosyltransferase, partial [Elusimicrobiota bacterium]
MKPFVSVLIDNRNYGRFLAQCIGSVLAQDYPADRMEIVLIDDGSTDDSLQVAASFGERIRVIAQANTGQAGA